MPNSAWTVNNSTKRNLVIINASVDSITPTEFYYDQSIALLPFPTGNLLAPDGSGVITIPDARRDANGDNLPFTFIVAVAETLAPIKAFTYNSDLSDLSDVTVDATAIGNANEAFAFYKDITAFPGSDMAKDFAALDYSDDTAVSNFFSRAEGYTHVTLDALHLVITYYNALPYGWAGGKDTVIYVYGGTYEGLTDSDKARSIATIKITNDWTQPLPVTVPQQFRMELQLNNDQVKSLVFSNGVFWDSAKTEMANLRLAGSFAVPGQLSLDEDNDDVCTFLVGSVNDSDAFGLQETEPQEPAEDGSFFALFKVHSFREGLNLGMYGIGIATGIFLLVKVGQFLRWCKTRNNPPIDQKEKTDQIIEALKQHITEKARTIISEVNEQIRVIQPEQLPEDQAAYMIEQLAIKTKQSVENVQEMLSAQVDQLNAIAKRMSGADLQAAEDNIELINDIVDRATSTGTMLEFRMELPNIMDKLVVNNTTIFTTKSRVDRTLTSQEQKAFERAFETYDQIRLTQERLNQKMKEIQDGMNDEEFREREPSAQEIQIEQV